MLRPASPIQTAAHVAGLRAFCPAAASTAVTVASVPVNEAPGIGEKTCFRMPEQGAKLPKVRKTRIDRRRKPGRIVEMGDVDGKVRHGFEKTEKGCDRLLLHPRQNRFVRNEAGGRRFRQVDQAFVSPHRQDARVLTQELRFDPVLVAPPVGGAIDRTSGVEVWTRHSANLAHGKTSCKPKVFQIRFARVRRLEGEGWKDWKADIVRLGGRLADGPLANPVRSGRKQP